MDYKELFELFEEFANGLLLETLLKSDKDGDFAKFVNKLIDKGVSNKIILDALMSVGWNKDGN